MRREMFCANDMISGLLLSLSQTLWTVTKVDTWPAGNVEIGRR